MSNLYVGLEAFKRAVSSWGTERNAIILRHIEAASRRIDQLTNRFFIPQTLTLDYSWPQWSPGRSYILWLDRDLLAVTTLKTKAQDTTPTTIVAADYFLEPQSLGPPYTRIEIDLSSSSSFEPGVTSQRAIEIAGSWGYTDDTVAAGALAEALDISETDVDTSDASLIDTGDTLLIDSEQMYVLGKGTLDTGTNTNGVLTANKAETSVVVGDGTKVKQGEVMLVNSERMYVESMSGNTGTVVRAYDGSVLAAHSDAQDVYVYRTLSVVRAINGTTAATHSNAAAISKYAPPLDIQTWCMAEAIATYFQEQAAWGREIGSGEGARELSGRSLADMRKSMKLLYGRDRSTAI